MPGVCFLEANTRVFTLQEKTTWRCASWAWRRQACRGSAGPRSSHGSSRRSGSAAAGSSTSAAPSRAGRRDPPTPRPCCRACSSDGARASHCKQRDKRTSYLTQMACERAAPGSDWHSAIFSQLSFCFILLVVFFWRGGVLGSEVSQWTLCRKIILNYHIRCFPRNSVLRVTTRP